MPRSLCRRVDEPQASSAVRGAGWLQAWVMAWLLALAWPALAQQAVPPLTARVTDLTGTLTPAQRQALETKLAELERSKGSQVAVLLVPTTQPESIEQFALRVAEAWRLGRKGVDDGVLLLVAKEDKALRIEVGYGLEGVIPDAVAKRIIADIMVPRFRAGDFAGGLDAGVDAISKLIAGEPLPPVPRQQAGESSTQVDLPVLLIFLLLAGGVLRALLGRLLGAGMAGGLAFFLTWWLVGSLLAGALLAMIVFVFTLAGGGGGLIHRGGGWGGGVGGGGFSGGGGGFGGGGASGRW